VLNSETNQPNDLSTISSIIIMSQHPSGTTFVVQSFFAAKDQIAKA